MSVEAHSETHEFQAEVRQLLNLMINALYSNKEIFLRELISNASDAADRLRFEALTDEALYEGDTELRIRVSFDADARTVTIEDNGIGMTRADVQDNIGTIARSGTRRFFESLTGDQAKDAQLIGQFGVGFYSAFIVADRVTVTTRRAGLGPEHGVRWMSDGHGTYTIENVEWTERGTEVVLHLREGEDEFLNAERLRHIIRKFSDHITVPIQMRLAEDGGWETVNRASALWRRPKSEISDEEYRELYKHIAHDFEDPLAWIHNHVEGKLSYTSLLYIPAHRPFDLWDPERHQGVKLYVRRVFVTDGADQLMPRYLRFIRGVVDSDDLPLNISREMLQHNRAIESIRMASTKRVLDLLDDIAAKDNDKYQRFWNEFGSVMKEGAAEDFVNRDRIAGLLRFSTTHTDRQEQTVSLQDYIGRMQPGQEKIYYVTADSFNAARTSPHLEVFRKKGIEVLLLGERVDEWMVAHLPDFDGRPLQSVAKGDLDLGDLEDESERQEAQEAASRYERLLQRLRDVLGDRVKDVRVTHRLTDSPACLVVEEQDLSVNLQHLLKQAGHEVPMTQPILELNPDHPLVQRLDDERDATQFGDLARVILDQSHLSEGAELDDPAGFVRRLNALLVRLAAERKEAPAASSGNGDG